MLKRALFVLTTSVVLAFLTFSLFLNDKASALPTTVFSDDFSTNSNAAYTTSGAIGASSFSVTTSGADWGARRNTSPAQLELTNDATATANANGWVFASTSTSSFSSPYNTTLSSNPGLVTWNLNMRQIRTDPAGFLAGNYGVAFILAGTSSTPQTTGNGYAVVLGQSGATDAIRLVSYTSGLQGTLTAIVTSNTTGLTDFGAEYLSIRVTYLPSTNTWELFLRNDGTTAFADPTSGSLTTQGTSVNNTHTSLALSNMGAYWQGSTGASQTAFFDNISVTVDTAAPTVTIAAQDAAASETGSDTGTFRISRTGATTSALNVSYAIDGMSTAVGADYTPTLTGSVTIPIGSAFVDITIAPVDDAFVEGSETLSLNLTDTVDYDLGSPASATVTIADNDSPPEISINNVSITEGNSGTQVLTFTISSSLPAPGGGFDGFMMNVSTMDGTATDANNDYEPISSQFVSIGPGESSVNVPITINGDTAFEADETFTVIISKQDAMDPSFIITDNTGIGTILNDDLNIIPIHDIQGSGNISPLSGSVITEGIVTGLRANGFYLQMPDAEYDANPATSEGIFVFTSSTPPTAATVGNRVRVTASVTEFIPSGEICSNSLLRPNCVPEASVTELTSPTVTLLSSGNPLPTVISLSAADATPTGGITQLEKYEFMRVRIDTLLTVAPTDGNVSEANATSTSDGVFQGIILSTSCKTLACRPEAPSFSIANRPYREAGIESPEPVPPGSGVTIPPIPRFDGNPERIRVDSDGMTATTRLDVSSNVTVSNLVGVLDYGFRTYTIIPDGSVIPSATANLSALPLPETGADKFTVASFNLERFFDTTNDPSIGEPVLTTTAFANRLNKASLAIRNILRSPDILGVVEMENLSTLQALANKINSDAVAASQPNPMYLPYLVEGNDVGGIDVGFLIKSYIVAGSTPRVTVTEVVQEGLAATYTNPTDGMQDLLNDRPPLRFTGFVNHPDGRTFPITVIVNHLRSLNGNNDPTPNGSSTDGGRVRAKRQAQAAFLANLVQTRQTNNPNERIALVGDFNAFKVNDGYANLMDIIRGVPTPDNEDVVPSVGDLVDPDLINLVADYPGSLSYTYVFGGNAQALDHILINDNLNRNFSQFFVAHLNADFPETYRNDPNRPERISDHDAPVACFEFDAPPDLSITKTHTGSFMVGATGQYSITVSNKVNDPGPVGPTAGTITVTDALPSNLSLASFSGTDWTCTGTTNVSCTHPGPLVAGDSLPVLTLTVNVGVGTPTGTDSITNTATVSTPAEASDTLTDNTADDPTTVLPLVCPMISVNPTSVSAGVVGSVYTSQTFTASGGTGPYTLALTSGSLPMGLTLTAGVLSGTPMQSGTFNFTITATDTATQCTGFRAYSLSITCPTITVSPATLPGAVVGTAYTGGVTASGGTGPYTFTTSSSLPMGLTLNSDGTITGTPMATGTFSLNVIATDSKGCTGNATVSLTVTCPTITVSPATLPGAVVGTAYTGGVTASGGTGPYTFTTSSSLPMGLTLNSDGTITGTPMATGTFSLNVIATDSKGCTGNATVSLTVTCPTITLSPATLPNGTSNIAYNQTITANGGNTPYTFAVTIGTLPVGLTLSSSGALSGLPTAVGSSTFTVTATDSKGCTGTMSYTIAISSSFNPSPTMSLTDPLACAGPGDLVIGTFGVTNTSMISQTGTVTVALPAGMIVGLPGTCTTNVGGCVVTATTVTWTGTLAAGETMSSTYQAQLGNSVIFGSTLCASTTAVFGANTGNVQACLTVNCSQVGPGVPPGTQNSISDQKAGSVLIYPIYSSSAANANSQNTRIAITNTNPSRQAIIHLFFVDGSSCSVADSYICLTPNQTASVLASDIDPGTTGYLVAVAVNAAGCPIDFNYLIGDEFVKLASGHQSNLGAESAAAIAGGLTACNAITTSNAVLNFDNISYNALPRVLASSNIPSRGDGNDTYLVIDRIGGNLSTSGSAIGGLFGILYDDAEAAYSFSLGASACQSAGSITNDRPRVVPRFETVIPSGRSGWFKVWGASEIGIVGAQINRNANAATNASAFNHGHNLHKLTLTTSASITIPVFPPSC